MTYYLSFVSKTKYLIQLYKKEPTEKNYLRIKEKQLLIVNYAEVSKHTCLENSSLGGVKIYSLKCNKKKIKSQQTEKLFQFTQNKNYSSYSWITLNDRLHVI